MSAQPDDAHARVKNLVHRDKVLQAEITRALEEYRILNREHFRAAEFNDLRRHYAATNRLPDLLRMLVEEIGIVKRHGPRRVSWWDAVDEEE